MKAPVQIIIVDSDGWAVHEAGLKFFYIIVDNVQ